LPEGLLSPENWALLTEGNIRPGGPAEELASGTIPIIVRLTGSPLMHVPHAPELLETANTSAFHHALVLDEYIAIQQTAADLALRGLLPRLTRNSSRGPQRFWLLLGTQLEDSAVRFRLVAPQIVNGLGPTESSEASAGEARRGIGYRSGVLVNERSQTSYRELFYWHDFDVVDAHHLSLVDDLRSLSKRVEEQVRSVSGRMPADVRAARSAEDASSASYDDFEEIPD
jgi:hypothetical protein